MLTNRKRLRQIVRPPYKKFGELPADPKAQKGNPDVFRDIRVKRDRAFDMRMPPYMRDSDSWALSLTRQQFELLDLVIERKLTGSVREDMELVAERNKARRRSKPGLPKRRTKK
jgi:hypothetical protein